MQAAIPAAGAGATVTIAVTPSLLMMFGATDGGGGPAAMQALMQSAQLASAGPTPAMAAAAAAAATPTLPTKYVRLEENTKDFRSGDVVEIVKERAADSKTILVAGFGVALAFSETISRSRTVPCSAPTVGESGESGESESEHGWRRRQQEGRRQQRSRSLSRRRSRERDRSPSRSRRRGRNSEDE